MLPWMARLGGDRDFSMLVYDSRGERSVRLQEVLVGMGWIEGGFRFLIRVS